MGALLSQIQRLSPLVAHTHEGDYEYVLRSSLPFLKLIPSHYNRVLVVGCGAGHEVKWLSDHGFVAVGVTNVASEALEGEKRYGVKIRVVDMHELTYRDSYFDCVFAANVLEHSVAPYVALREWRRVLKKDGLLVVVMPSKEWVAEYYHFSVLTHYQMKDLIYKAGFELLAGPGVRPKISLQDGDIFYDLGRGWGHYDGYVCRRSALPKTKFVLTGPAQGATRKIPVVGKLRRYGALVYGIMRRWYARRHFE